MFGLDLIFVLEMSWWCIFFYFVLFDIFHKNTIQMQWIINISYFYAQF